MSPQRTKMTVLSAAVGAMAVLATGGMAMGPPFEPVRLSSLNAGNIEGYAVFDRYGEHVGHVAGVENKRGRTFWITVALDQGGAARVASFRAFLDARSREVGLVLTRDLIQQRAEDQANDAADKAAFDAVMPASDSDGEKIASAAQPSDVQPSDVQAF